jgi:hypothetical protein
MERLTAQARAAFAEIWSLVRIAQISLSFKGGF